MPSSRPSDIDARHALRIAAIGQGLLLAMIVALAGFALLSVVSTLSGWDELPSSLYAFHYVSIAVGGLQAARRAQRWGWLHGGMVGLLYALLVAGFMGTGQLAQFQVLVQPSGLLHLFLAFIAGSAGGMLGVNF